MHEYPYQVLVHGTTSKSHPRNLSREPTEERDQDQDQTRTRPGPGPGPDQSRNRPRALPARTHATIPPPRRCSPPNIATLLAAVACLGSSSSSSIHGLRAFRPAAVAAFSSAPNRAKTTFLSRGRIEGHRGTPGVGVGRLGPPLVLSKHDSCRTTSTRLLSMKNKKGKTVAKENLPSKVCVVCNRPFTWRKKWERVWDEVTTCSKSCNAKRRQMAKQQQQTQRLCGSEDDDSLVSASCSLAGEARETEPLDHKAALRKQRKEAVKAQKQARKLKRMGIAPREVGRKPCDLCSKPVDLLVRCTVDETQTYKMVCGRCWPRVSGGVPDGVSATHPHYRYGGLWKNRNADLKKKVGSGRGGKKGKNSGRPPSPLSLTEEIELSLVAAEEEDDER